MTDTTRPARAGDTTPADAITPLPHLLGVLRSQVTAALEDWFSNETVNYAAGIEPADAVMAVVGPALEQVHGHRTEVAARAAERRACIEQIRGLRTHPTWQTDRWAYQAVIDLLAAEDTPPATTEETR